MSNSNRIVHKAFRRRELAIRNYGVSHGLQSELSTHERVADDLGLDNYFAKTELVTFRKNGHLAGTEKWNKGQARMEAMNHCK